MKLDDNKDYTLICQLLIEVYKQGRKDGLDGVHLCPERALAPIIENLNKNGEDSSFMGILFYKEYH